MINATALRLVSAENMNVVSNVSNVLTKSSQNIKIEYSKQADLVPPAVERLALRMLKLDAEIRGFLNELRILFGAKREDFHFSLRGVSNEGKAGIIDDGNVIVTPEYQKIEYAYRGGDYTMDELVFIAHGNNGIIQVINARNQEKIIES